MGPAGTLTGASAEIAEENEKMPEAGVSAAQETGEAAARRKRGLAFTLAAVAVTAALLWLCYSFDNKYTRPRPLAEQGVTRLNMEWFDRHPFFYLADGWTFYHGLLTPEEAAGRRPDASFYIGRYGGFDLGDPEANPRGEGTYRAVIVTDGREREYALELTPVFSQWRLWVNGELRQSVGFGGETVGAPSGFITFRARGNIEIVVAARDDRSFYSGMVYPPAFGSPKRVERTVALRLLLHGAGCAVALLLCAACLTVGRMLRSTRPYGALALLCLCFFGSTVWPVAQAFGIFWGGSPFQRFFYYGIFLSLIWIQARICQLPGRVYLPACGLGTLVCAAVLVQPLFPAAQAAGLMGFSAALGAYKWITAGWLLSTGLWAIRAGRRYSSALLAGNCAFACALVMDKLLPLYEPVYTGWFVELAGGLLMALVGGIAFCDTARVWREDAALRAEHRLAEAQLAARAEHARLQQDYVRRTREQLHESRNRLTLISHYLDRGELDKLRAFLDGITLAGDAPGPRQYTGNSLVDAILTLQMDRAEGMDIYVERELCPLPEILPCSDGDMTSLLMNLLDNALEANGRLGPEDAKWIDLRLCMGREGLEIMCANASPPPEDGQTSKRDKLAHGFGLKLVREIARRHGGEVRVERPQGRFSISITLHCADSPSVSQAALSDHCGK